MYKMAKSNPELSHRPPHATSDEDTIVISGIAGCFPESDSVKELETKLFNKEDMVTDEPSRWNTQNPSYPRWGGKIRNIDKFDASFFGIDFKHAHSIDPMARIMMEKAYEALIDAGVNPIELRNTRTGVFSAACVYESEMYWQYSRMHVNPNGILGCSRSMAANRISQWLGVTGPSVSVETGCGSSINALDMAFKAIRDGICDAAIVTSSSLCIHPVLNQNFVMLNMLSPDGRCKCFDASGDGYVRSDAVVACFIQKSKDARRAYAQIIHTKTFCDGYKKEGIMYPHVEMQKFLLREFYKDTEYTPADIEFLEAHSTGTKYGDTFEVEAIDEVFCQNRSETLLVGSIKSNLGHVEAASGLTSLVKLSIAYNTGYIPPNLHYKTPREGFPCLKNGKLQVVVEKQPWGRGLAAMNNYGFGGIINHVLFKNVSRPKVNNGLPSDDLPRLVLASGRTVSAVTKIFEDLLSRTMDVEEIGLLHEIFARDIPRHSHRGFALLDSTPTQSVLLASSVECYRGNRPTLRFLYPGIYSYWPGTVKQLMKIAIFAETFKRCNKFLADINIDLLQVVKAAASCDYLMSVLVTVAFQISITELLKDVGVEPDFVVGQDVGEFVCAYFDGSWTLEETMLAAYKFATSADGETSFDSLKDLRNLPSLPKFKTKQSKTPNIDVDSTTNIEKADTDFYEELLDTTDPNDVVLAITDLVPKSFIDGCSKMDVVFLSLMHERLGDQIIVTLLTGLGKLYEIGYNPQVAKLYPPVQFPVSQGTPMLSHLVEWDHSENWYIMKYEQKKLYTSHRTIIISLDDDDFEYLAGHVINGVNIYPLSCLLVHVWETFGMCLGKLYSELPVIFTNVCSLDSIEIPENGKVEFDLSLHRDSGDFEIIAKDTILVTGTIKIKNNSSRSYHPLPLPGNDVQKYQLQSNEFYKELRIRGYQYISDKLRGILNCSIDGSRATVSWENCWVSYLDALMQLTYFNIDTRNIYVPAKIERLSIDPAIHYGFITKQDVMNVTLEAFVYPYIDVVRSGGVELRGLSTKLIKRKPYPPSVTEYGLFVPYFDSRTIYTIDEIMRIHLQTVLENTQTYNCKCIELIDKYEKNGLQSIKDTISNIIDDWLLIVHNIIVVNEDVNVQNESNAIVFIGANLLERHEVLNNGIQTLREAGCVISREKSYPIIQDYFNFEIASIYSTGQEYFVLLRRKTAAKTTTFCKIGLNDQTFSWIDEVREAMKEYERVVLYSQGETDNGLLGLIHTFRKEPGCEKICGILIADATAPAFDPNLELYKEQLQNKLAFNVFKNGLWGAYRNLKLDSSKPVSVTHGYVNVTNDGHLCSLQWVEGPLTADSCVDKKTLVHVYSSGLNQRDLQIAEGNLSAADVMPDRIEPDCLLGAEVAGRIANGSRVMGIVPRYGITNLASVDNQFLWPIPDKWSMTEAASVPYAYLTAYLALVLEAELHREDSIFVDNGASDVGQAVINVALSFGCKVFTTVNTDEKKAFIEKFGVTAILIINEEDTCFEQVIMSETKRKGVNIFLGHVLQGEKLQAALRCLGHHGRFIQIGNRRKSDNINIYKEFMNESISFHSTVLENIFDKSENFKKELAGHFLKGLRTGVVRPLNYTIFENDKVNTAFRYMADDRNFGKVIIKVRDEEVNLDSKPKLQAIEAIPTYICNEEHVYIVVGGLGGFGLELSEWLIVRGARKLVLASSRGLTTGYQAMKLRKFATYGAEVQISTDDITTEDGCEKLLKKGNSMGTVAAIFNLAAILKDATFQNHTPDNFKASFGPKGLATIHLDKLSRKMCPELKDFVGFSSLVTSGRGNAGQTNYGYSNSVIERVCENRKMAGFPGLAVQWGPISDVGMLASLEDLDVGGSLPQNILACLETLHMFLKQEKPIVSSLIVGKKEKGAGAQKSASDIIAQLLGIKDLKTISLNTTIGDLGIDSIISREIHEFLERKFEKFLSPAELTVLPLSRLMEFISEGDKSKK